VMLLLSLPRQSSHSSSSTPCSESLGGFQLSGSFFMPMI
jgi:hypothetical protein